MAVVLIGCDIDGVLFPWDDAARDALVERFGIERPPPSTHWTYLKDVLPGELWSWLWSADGQNETFGRVECTYPDAILAVNALLRAGHHVHFVTHRDPRRTAIHTAAFLAIHFGGHPWAGVHVIQNSVAKRRIQPWDVFIDDKPETVWDFLDNTGVVMFAPRRPWNAEELDGVGDGRGLMLYDDAQDIVRWVEAGG